MWFEKMHMGARLTRGRLLTVVFYQPNWQRGFPDSSVVKESAFNAGDPGSITGLGRSPGEGSGYPLQYSGLENSMDCIVHGVTKSQTQQSNFHSLTPFLSTVICSSSLQI